MDIKSRAKEVVREIVLLPFRVMMRLNMREGAITNTLNQIMEIMDSRSQYFYSVKRRPKRADDIYTLARPDEIYNKTAIIMQGVLVDEFTLETLRLYGKLYPGVLVVVSVWASDDLNIIEKLQREKNCIVILNEYPSYSGLLNVNYQVMTTVAGLKRAKAEGREFAFKTRCDYRFYKRELIHYLYNLIIHFPIEEFASHQNYRIVAGSEIMNSMFKPFWLADQFNYGQIDDMIQYWSRPMDTFNLDKESHRRLMKGKKYSWKEQVENRMGAESELVLSYLERTMGERPDISVKEYWRVIKERFIVVSRQELGAYWGKYLFRYDESIAGGEMHDSDSPERGLTYNWDFSTWFSLYCGTLLYDNSYESFAKKNGWNTMK